MQKYIENSDDLLYIIYDFVGVCGHKGIKSNLFDRLWKAYGKTATIIYFMAECLYIQQGYYRKIGP